MMVQLNKTVKDKPARPVKILQYGEGNFLRAFADYFFQVINEKTNFNGNIEVIKPRDGKINENFQKQDGLYTVKLCGSKNGSVCEEIKNINIIEEVISPYSDYDRYISFAESDQLQVIISNTTEAGIVYSADDDLAMTPPSSFPAKLTQFLYRRYLHFGDDPKKGLVILSCELIDNNGDRLKEIVFRLAEKWKLGQSFISWIENSCYFCNTLVDRIVSGFPKESAETIFHDLGYRDELLVSCEPFGLWVIEAPEAVQRKLHMNLPELPILFTNNHKPYKKRKVRILNGAHTAFTASAVLCGKTYVNEALKDSTISGFLNHVLFEEIVPILGDDVENAKEFAMDVLDRFANPFINHALTDICLNSVSKWQTRCMPSLFEYAEKKGALPKGLTFSLAAIISYYKGIEKDDNGYFSMIDGKRCKISDDAAIMQFFMENKEMPDADLCETLLKQAFMDDSLLKAEGFLEQLCNYVSMISNIGCREAIRHVMR